MSQSITFQREYWPDKELARVTVNLFIFGKRQSETSPVLPAGVADLWRNRALLKVINSTLTRFVNQRRRALQNSLFRQTNEDAIRVILSAIDASNARGLSYWRANINRIEPSLLWLCPKSPTNRFYQWRAIIEDIITFLK